MVMVGEPLKLIIMSRSLKIHFEIQKKSEDEEEGGLEGGRKEGRRRIGGRKKIRKKEDWREGD